MKIYRIYNIKYQEFYIIKSMGFIFNTYSDIGNFSFDHAIASIHKGFRIL